MTAVEGAAAPAALAAAAPAEPAAPSRPSLIPLGAPAAVCDGDTCEVV